MKLVQHRGQPVIAGVAFRAQPDLTPRSAVESLDLDFGSAQFVEHPARACDQPLPGGVSTIFLPSRKNKAVPSFSSASRN